MIDFSDKVVLVTGAGAGIGRATAEMFGEAGAKIAFIEIDPARTEDARTALEAAGVETLAVTGDVTDPSAVADLAVRVEARFGRLDVLVNNVGDFLMAKPFETLTDEEVERLYAVNLRHVFSVTKTMIPLLRKAAPGSGIVTVSSVEGFRGIPNCVVYGACKAAITGFTQSLALELGPAGIRVNLIAPETTETAQVPVSLMIAPEHRHHLERWTPLGRFGRPEDMAGAILFLASPLAGWITGAALHIDGGALAAAGWVRDPRGAWTNMPVITGNGMNL